MRDAIAALVVWQQKVAGAALPPYDDALLRRELALFPDWCVVRECGVTWNGGRDGGVGTTPATSSSPARSRSRSVAVHRDWMPRNLMVSRPEPRHPRLPGRGARADRLRRRLAAARRLHLVGRGAGARLGGPLLAGGAQGRAAGATPTSASSGATSNGSACSAT